MRTFEPSGAVLTGSQVRPAEELLTALRKVSSRWLDIITYTMTVKLPLLQSPGEPTVIYMAKCLVYSCRQCACQFDKGAWHPHVSCMLKGRCSSSLGTLFTLHPAVRQI